jgi:multidrug efflux system membrane fusion protein
MQAEDVMNKALDPGAEAAPAPGRSRPALWRLLLLVGLVVGVGVFITHHRGHAKAPASAGPPAVPVTVGPAKSRDLPLWRSGIGSVQPLNVVNVKVRVDGQLERVLFTEGRDVHAGELLAQIDPRPFEAQLKQAEANLAKDQAQLANAQVDLGRFTRLASLGASSTQNVDTLKAQVASLQATLQADQAEIDTAKLQLEFTHVKSPINGRVGLRAIDPGSIVHTTDASGLVTVTQMEPIAVIFSLPQDDLPEVVAASAQGKLSVEAMDRDGTHSLAQGELVFVDSQVDPGNGMVRLKATFPNTDRSLWPGELVTARLLVRTEKNATVVPTKAVLRGQNGTYVYALKPDQTVEMRPVKTGPTVEGFTAVRSGLAPAETVVLEGQSRLAPGAKVDAKQAPAETAALGASR